MNVSKINRAGEGTWVIAFTKVTMFSREPAPPLTQSADLRSVQRHIAPAPIGSSQAEIDVIQTSTKHSIGNGCAGSTLSLRNTGSARIFATTFKPKALILSSLSFRGSTLNKLSLLPSFLRFFETSSGGDHVEG